MEHHDPQCCGVDQDDPGKILCAYGCRPQIFPGGYIQGYLLKDGPDYCLLVTADQYRMAATGPTRLFGEYVSIGQVSGCTRTAVEVKFTFDPTRSSAPITCKVVNLIISLFTMKK